MSEIPPPRLRFVVDGDSIVWNDRWLRFALDAADDRYTLPEGYNHAVGGATTWQVLDRTQDVIRLSPDVVALHVGTNDLSSSLDTPDAIHRNIQRICRAYLDNGAACVIVICVLPRSDYYWKQLGPRQRDRHVLNRLLRRMPHDRASGADRDRIRIVDLEAAFDPDIRTVDGLHPSLTGARMLGRAIGRHLARSETASARSAPAAEKSRLGWLSRTHFGGPRSWSAI